MKLPLRYFGDPILRARARPIGQITEEIRTLAQDMIDTMLANNGVGLAAPQVGILLRMYVFREERLSQDGHYELGAPQVVLNPVLSAPSKEEEEMLEGCLSLPGLHVKVRRPKKIHISYQNLRGEQIESDLCDFSARVNMHENDHLNGTLHIDRISAKEKKEIESLLQMIKHKYAKQDKRS